MRTIAVAFMSLVAACSQASIPMSQQPQPGQSSAARTSAVTSATASKNALSAWHEHVRKNDLSAGDWVALLPMPDDPNLTMLPDGEIVDSPPTDDEVVDPANGLSCLWSGNVPPPCTNTGPFRRQYTSPGASYIESQLIPPVSQPTWPTCSGGNSTGYLYLEGWPGAAQANIEAGLIYSVLNNRYSEYLSVGGSNVWYDENVNDTIKPGSTIFVALEVRDPSGCVNTSLACVVGHYGGTCWNGSTQGCGAQHQSSAPAGWSGSGCCIMASMVAIAQKKGNHFANGDIFGPIETYVAAAPSFSSCCGPWGSMFVGGQKWPKDTTKIIVGPIGSGHEKDTINLHT